MLGIDPGLTRCGYAVLHAAGNTVRPIALGVIRTPPTDPLPTRLAELKGELVLLLQQYRPFAVAVEQVFFQT
ncbi:MAG: crossover junction endodeoxyribonuclease RuvC, partial [Ilumatobacteraceae bacterium]|nr:crossover junction endodeoxyribonuclease RuvC [Ilumatobacteraceae bacterium]